MNGFERRKERNKDSIRRAALELFGNYGIQKVTMADIATKAGVSPVTIYNHFGSKEDLVRDTVKELAETYQRKYQEILRSDRPFLERLETVMFDKIETFKLYHSEFIWTMVSEDPEMLEFITDFFETRLRPMMDEFYREGQREGFIDSSLSMDSIMLYLQIVRDGFRAYARTHPEVFSGKEGAIGLLKEMWILITFGLVGRARAGETVPTG